MKNLIFVSSLLFSCLNAGAFSGDFNGRLSLQTSDNGIKHTKIQSVTLEPVQMNPTICYLTAATDQIITEIPEGTRMEEVVWSSKACYPDNSKVTWTEVSGFVPTIVTNGNKMYIYSPITQLSELATAWIRGEISADGKTVTFPTPQAYMMNEATPGVVTMLYATRVSSSTGKPEAQTDLIFSISDDGDLVQTDGGLLALTDINGNFYGFGDMDIKVSKIHETYTTLPENATPETFILDYKVGKDSMRQSALVAELGDDVYFSDPLAIEGVWFKGTFEGGKVIVKTPQYMSAKSGYPLYLVAAEEFTRTETDPLGQVYDVLDYKVLKGEDIVFEYDDAEGTFISKQVLLMTSDKDKRGTASAGLKAPGYTPWTPVGCVPVTPSVNYYVDLDGYEAFGLKGCMLACDIPNEGPEGEFIPQENLYYSIYFDEKPLEFYGATLLPYYGQFQDAATQTAITVAGSQHQIQTSFKPQNTLGVKSYYYFNGQFIESETATYKIVNGELEGAGAELIVDEPLIVSSEYFDITGMPVKADTEGLVIRRDVMSDGSVRSMKTINKIK